MLPTEPDSPDSWVLRPAVQDDLPAIADLYIATRAAAVPLMPAGIHPDAGVRAYVGGWDLSRRDVWVAESDLGLRAFASLEDDWLGSLYVHPDEQGTGLGSALLDVVKSLRPGGFSLWVFETNTPARAFYARHGLVEREHTDGSENEEKSPDLRMSWP